MSEYCNYCHKAKSLFVGDVYCSNHGRPMEEMENAVALLVGNGIESAEHVSRLSIRLALNGRQLYKVNGHDHLVTPQNYLVLNQGQRYQTVFEAGKEQEMFLVAFRPGFAEGLLHSLVTPQDRLLDNPAQHNLQPVQFFEQTQALDTDLQQSVSWLRHYIGHPDARLLDLDTVFSTILEKLLQNHRNVYRQVEQMSPVRLSTRVELYRRLSLARDYMEAHYHEPLCLDLLAGIACLSKFHFLRLFRQLYGLSPHQYLLAKRLQLAAELLKTTGSSLAEVAAATGFQDTGSFSKIFRKKYGTAPSAIRRG